jgi:hypothetical protein
MLPWLPAAKMANSWPNSCSIGNYFGSRLRATAECHCSKMVICFQIDGYLADGKITAAA